MSIFSGKALERMKRIGTYRPDQEIVDLFLDGYKTHVKNKGTLTAPECMGKFNLSYPELENVLKILTNDRKIYADESGKINFYSEASVQSQGPFYPETKPAGNDGNGDFNRKLPRRGRTPFNASQEQKEIFEKEYSDYFNKNRGFPEYGDFAGSGISYYILAKMVSGLIRKGEARIEKAGAKKKIVLKKYEDMENEYSKTALVPVKENPRLKLGRMFQKSPAKNGLAEFWINYNNFVIRNGACPELPERANFAGGCTTAEATGQLAGSGGIKTALQNEKAITSTVFGKRKRINPGNKDAFLEKYGEYLENKGQLPGISEFADYSGLGYQALRKIIDEMKKEGTVNLVRVGKEKKIELMDSQAKDMQSQKSAAAFSARMPEYSETGKKAFISLLENVHVKDYLSGLLSNNGSSMKPEIAVKIVSAVPFYAGDEDKKIFEELKADCEVSKWFMETPGNKQIKKEKEDSRSLSKVRHCLFELFDKKIVSYNVEENDGWRTYLWHISPSAPDALKESCISDIRKRKKSLEGMKQKVEEYAYFCKEDKTHPAIPFGSKSYVDKFTCEVCGKGLVLESGSRIAETIDADLEKLNAAIGEIEQIKV